MKVDVSVIICCFNSAPRLPETLKHLAVQIANTINWEVVLVNNKSTDDTVEVAELEWNKLGSPAQLLVVNEETPGLTFARKKGIEICKGDVIIFCDDDNWLVSDYIIEIYNLFKSTRYRMVGGWGIPVAESDFPAWFNQFEGYGYAVGKQGRMTGEGYAVHGAGMAIRKSDALILIDHRYKPLLSDRKGKSLSTGGDAEINILFGGRNRYFHEGLIYYHYLPSDRLNWNYFLNLNYYIGIADSYLYFYKLVESTSNIALKKYIYKMFSSVEILFQLTKKSLKNKPTLEEKIAFTYQKGFTLFLFFNIFKFKRIISFARNNKRLFNNIPLK